MEPNYDRRGIYARKRAYPKNVIILTCFQASNLVSTKSVPFGQIYSNATPKAW